MAEKRTDKSLNSAAKSGKFVLAMRFSALGDVAMTIPPLYEACRSNADRQFLMLTRKRMAQMFVNPPENLKVLGIDLNAYKGIKGLYRLFSELRSRYDIEAIADLHDVLRTKILRALFRSAGVRVAVIDKRRAERRRLTRRKNKVLKALRPVALRYADTLDEALGVMGEMGVMGGMGTSSIFPSRPEPAIFAAATDAKEPAECWLAIAPFAAHAGKVYPAPKMMEVIDSLVAHPHFQNLKIFIFGFGEEESRRIEEWRKERPNIINMAALNIGMLAELALMAHCDAMLTMDSANMHLARLAGLRTISIWGATHPYAGFLPADTLPEDILQVDLDCRPCSIYGSKPCYRGDYPCLNAISPERVVAALDNAINKTENEK